MRSLLDLNKVAEKPVASEGSSMMVNSSPGQSVKAASPSKTSKGVSAGSTATTGSVFDPKKIENAYKNYKINADDRGYPRKSAKNYKDDRG